MKKKMTRAEEAALEAYPRDDDRDLNFRRANYRIAYERGYVQAEKDIISLIDSLQQEQPYWEPSESEDERIRKELKEAFEAYDIESKWNGIPIRSIFAWLEKQKEQKPAQTVDEKEYVRTLKGLVSDFIRDSGGGITDVEYYQNICDWLDGRHIEQKPVVTHGETYHVDTLGTQQVIAGKMPQKSAEWSEEDKDKVVQYLHDRDGGMLWSKATEITSDILDIIRPRPSWKPSENQMSMLLAVVNDPNNAGSESCHLSLKSLYNDLKKL